MTLALALARRGGVWMDGKEREDVRDEGAEAEMGRCARNEGRSGAQREKEMG